MFNLFSTISLELKKTPEVEQFQINILLVIYVYFTINFCQSNWLEFTRQLFKVEVY